MTQFVGRASINPSTVRAVCVNVLVRICAGGSAMVVPTATAIPRPYLLSGCQLVTWGIILHSNGAAKFCSKTLVVHRSGRGMFGCFLRNLTLRPSRILSWQASWSYRLKRLVGEHELLMSEAFGAALRAGGHVQYFSVDFIADFVHAGF